MNMPLPTMGPPRKVPSAVSMPVTTKSRERQREVGVGVAADALVLQVERPLLQAVGARATTWKILSRASSAAARTALPQPQVTWRATVCHS